MSAPFKITTLIVTDSNEESSSDHDDPGRNTTSWMDKHKQTLATGRSTSARRLQKESNQTTNMADDLSDPSSVPASVQPTTQAVEVLTQSTSHPTSTTTTTATTTTAGTGDAKGSTRETSPDVPRQTHKDAETEEVASDDTKGKQQPPQKQTGPVHDIVHSSSPGPTSAVVGVPSGHVVALHGVGQSLPSIVSVVSNPADNVHTPHKHLEDTDLQDLWTPRSVPSLTGGIISTPGIDNQYIVRRKTMIRTEGSSDEDHGGKKPRVRVS